MYLKSLHISGFKSFAQKINLSFPKGITAVVGPNGSGKSNLVEAIRWVMGEQSMKSLRTKKSEDLIYSGSKKTSRQNKAEVEINLDNHERIFPLDFDEIRISRKVYRDGISEYYLNDSQVRLKDIIELLSRARIGVSGYSVISQGMADALLNVSSSERRGMIDEALGLKEYQTKKKESLDKLGQTMSNLQNVESIIAELTPHIRFLKRQAAKLEQRHIVEEHLKDLTLYFCAKENEILKNQNSNFEHEKTALSSAIEEKRAEIQKIEAELKIEMEESREENSKTEDKIQEEYGVWQDKKINFERELVKIDITIDHYKTKETDEDLAVTTSYIKEVLSKIYNELKKTVENSDMEGVKRSILEALSVFDGLFAEIEEGKKKKETKNEDNLNSELISLKKKKEEVALAISEVDAKIEEIRNALRARSRDAVKDKEKLIILKDNQHENQLAISKLTDQIRIIQEKEQGMAAQRRIFDEFFESLNDEEKKMVLENKVFEKFSIKEREGSLNNFDSDGLRREIDKLKIRLEVAQDVDPETEKEYRATQERYDFLVSQMADLNESIKSLHEIITNLDDKINEIFKEGFKVINEEFNKFFRMLFEGGKASLIRKSQLKMKMPIAGDEEEDLGDEEAEAEDEEEGNKVGYEEKNEVVDISVDLPKKKIHSVNMLSGGERTLTSIALLFAFVSYASPPFLVVDEVDAALDESNSFRFAKILNDLSKKTQFIAITHNRETMRHSDVLYGLTMDDSGVSNVLSLKFDETVGIE